MGSTERNFSTWTANLQGTNNALVYHRFLTKNYRVTRKQAKPTQQTAVFSKSSSLECCVKLRPKTASNNILTHECKIPMQFFRAVHHQAETSHGSCGRPSVQINQATGPEYLPTSSKLTEPSVFKINNKTKLTAAHEEIDVPLSDCCCHSSHTYFFRDWNHLNETYQFTHVTLRSLVRFLSTLCWHLELWPA